MPHYPAHPFLTFIQQQPKIINALNEDITTFFGPGWYINYSKAKGRYEVRHKKARFALKETVHFQEAWCWLYFAAVHEIDIKTGQPRKLAFNPYDETKGNTEYIPEPNDPNTIELDFGDED